MSNSHIEEINSRSAKSDFSWRISGFAGSRMQAVLLGFSMFVSVLSFSLGNILTSSRLALLLMVPLTAATIISLDYRLPSHTLIPLFAAFALFIASSFSMLLNGGDLWPMFAWLPLGLLGACFAICASRAPARFLIFFFGATILCEMFLWTTIGVRLQRADVLIVPGQVFRNWFEQHLFGGVNAFLNSMVLLSCLNFAALYSGIFRSIVTRFLFFLPIVFTFLCSLNCGSRQSLLALIVCFLALEIQWARRGQLRMKGIRSAFRVLVILGIVAFGLFIMIRKNWLNWSWIEKRFVGTLITREVDVGSDQTRIDLIRKAMRDSCENGGSGIGPGRFNERHEIYPHHGYAGFLAETGLLFGGIALLIVAAAIAHSWRRSASFRSTVADHVWIAFLTMSLFMMHFNDLFRDSAFWALLGLAVGLSSSGSMIGNRGESEKPAYESE